MAGLTQVNEEIGDTRHNSWVKPRELLERDQEFCLYAIEQDSYNQNGDPQYTMRITYVHEGVVQDRAFQLKMTDWRKVRYPVYEQHLPLHKLHLVENSYVKDGRTIKFMDLEDVPGSVDDGKCSCHNYGVIDPDDPSTWTEHYRLSREVNDYLEETNQGRMETGSMSVDALRLMARGLGLKVA